MNNTYEALHILIFLVTGLLGFVAAMVAIALAMLGMAKPAGLLMLGSCGWLFEALAASDRMKGVRK